MTTSVAPVIRIRVDDYLFTVCKKTIDKFPNSILYKVISGTEQVDFIHMDGNSLYIDINLENIKIIIDYLRGYNIPNNYNKSLEFDFSRLGLEFTPEIIKKNVNSNISDNTNIENDGNLCDITNNNIIDSVDDDISTKRIVRCKKEKIDL